MSRAHELATPEAATHVQPSKRARAMLRGTATPPPGLAGMGDELIRNRAPIRGQRLHPRGLRRVVEVGSQAGCIDAKGGMPRQVSGA